jgi:predicted nucleic acid-binding protein
VIADRNYLDSSVVIAWLLQEPGRLPEPRSFRLTISSELIRVEVARTLYRNQLEGRLTPDSVNQLRDFAEVWFAQMEIFPVFPAVLQRATGPFPTVVGSLDAIHLATAQLWQEDTGERLTIFTLDRQLRAASLACGFATLPL